jgi:hypothetical protein
MSIGKELTMRSFLLMIPRLKTVWRMVQGYGETRQVWTAASSMCAIVADTTVLSWSSIQAEAIIATIHLGIASRGFP